MDESRDKASAEVAHDSSPNEDFGSQLQVFYIALRGTNPYDLADAMSVLERTTAEMLASESDASLTAALQDIVADCQKKCAQVLRSRVADNVSSLLTAARKKLRAKVSKDAESSVLHNKRHISCMLELLGGWSDIIAGIMQGGVSDKVKSLIILPFHIRVMEVSFECFEEFKSDKNIENWLKRVFDSEEDLNLVVMDVILAQLAGMRELSMQYQSFLLDTCMLVDIPLGDFDAWKELDVVYCALDHAYNGIAIQVAVQDCKRSLLLCAEDDRPVFVLQGVEDAFFIIRKSVDRAISTGSDMILFSVMNRMMELLGHERDDQLSSAALLQTILSTRPYYRAVYKHSQRSFNEDNGDKIVSDSLCKQEMVVDNTTNTLEITEAMINSGTDAAVSVGMGIASVLASAVSHYSAGEGGPELASGALDSTVNTVSNLVGAANGWFSVFSEIAAPMPKEHPKTPVQEIKKPVRTPPPSLGRGNNPGDISGSNSSSKCRSSVEMIEDSLLNDEDIQLSIDDAIVRLNTLGIARTSVLGLMKTIGTPNAGEDGDSMTSSIYSDSPSGIIQSELSRCFEKLKEHGESASEDLAVFIYEQYLLPPLRSALMYDVDAEALDSAAFFDSVQDTMKPRSYEINALEFDFLSTERRLRRAICSFFDVSASWEDSASNYDRTPHKAIGSNGEGLKYEVANWTESRLHFKMTNLVFSEFVGHLATCTATYIVSQLFTLRYSEWGAMLMHQEVMSVIQCFDKSVEGSDINWSNTFRKLKGLLKILTLQQPADILRYISSSLLSADINEDEIRKVMKQRTDFSKEAVERIKLS